MTKYLVAFLFCFAFTTVVFAKDAPKWPKTIRELKEADFEPTAAKDIPQGVALYNRGEDETPESRSKRVIHIARVDLNGDSVPELVVGADAGGSAGGYYDVYQKQGDAYKCIGNLGAGFGIRILAKNNGFCQIEIWSRGGAGAYVRELYRYEKGEYRNVRTDDYRGYQGTYLGTQIQENP